MLLLCLGFIYFLIRPYTFEKFVQISMPARCWFQIVPEPIPTIVSLILWTSSYHVQFKGSVNAITQKKRKNEYENTRMKWQYSVIKMRLDLSFHCCLFPINIRFEPRQKTKIQRSGKRKNAERKMKQTHSVVPFGLRTIYSRLLYTSLPLTISHCIKNKYHIFTSCPCLLQKKKKAKEE